jgi:hypothetical protein
MRENGGDGENDEGDLRRIRTDPTSLPVIPMPSAENFSGCLGCFRDRDHEGSRRPRARGARQSLQVCERRAPSAPQSLYAIRTQRLVAPVLRTR